MELKLVEQAGFEVLLGDVGAAANRYILVAGRRLGLFKGSLDSPQ